MSLSFHDSAWWDVTLVAIGVVLGFTMPIIKELIQRVCRRNKIINLLKREIALNLCNCSSIKSDIIDLLDAGNMNVQKYPTNKITYPLATYIMQNPPIYISSKQLQIIFYIYEASVVLAKNMNIFIHQVVEEVVAGRLHRMTGGTINPTVAGHGNSLLESCNKYLVAANWTMNQLNNPFTRTSPLHEEGLERLSDPERTDMQNEIEQYIEQWGN
jgi:hypothetical protein